MTEWRRIESAEALTGAENMAVDSALFEGVQAGGSPVLRFYRWAPACLSFGRNQPVASPETVRSAAVGLGIDVVRRPTGGFGVFHDKELTYAVIAPVGLLGSPRESYVAINRALVAGLRKLGVEAEVAGAGAGRRPRSGGRDWIGPCFQEAAAGEVVVGGRKLVGSAQRCERRTLLQHGSLLLAGSQAAVVACLDDGGPDAISFTTLTALLGHVPPWQDLTSALGAGFEEVLGIRLVPDRLSDDERARAESLTVHYRSDAWTWRR